MASDAAEISTMAGMTPAHHAGSQHGVMGQATPVLHCTPNLSSFGGGWLGCSKLVGITRHERMLQQPAQQLPAWTHPCWLTEPSMLSQVPHTAVHS